MNYEDLHETLQTLEKDLKTRLSSMQTLQKALVKKTDSGDLQGLAKDLASLKELSERQAGLLDEIQAQVESFDSQAYLSSGEFAEQMLAYCRENQVDVKGEYPVYEMFPYRVRFDSENQDIYLDRKKIPCIRPLSFVQTIKTGQEKLNKASFNEATFASELADAYDTAILKTKRHPGTDFSLKTLYKYLAPMGRFRKEYDQQSFAFDLARLYSSGLEETKNGRRFQFGPSRKIEKSIRILDKEGREQYLATIRFF